MSLFFFDVHDGERMTRDDTGLECDSHDEIRSAAIRVLVEVASDELPNSDQHVLSVKVRSEPGRYVFHATLSLVAEWLDEPAV